MTDLTRSATQLFWKPLFLSVLALLLMLFSNSAPFFAVAVGIAAGIALWDLWCMVIRVETTRFSFTFAVSILLGYGLGSAIYLISHQTLHAARYQYWAPEGLLFDQQELAMGLAVSMLAAAALYARAVFERPVYSNNFLESLANPKAERLVWLGAGLAILALYMGQIGYEGTIVSDTGRVSALGVIANLMVPPLIPYTLLLICGKRSLAKKLLLAAALAMLVGVTFLLGRRYLLYIVVLTAMALRMQGYRFTKRGLAVGAGFGIIAGLVLYWGFNFFLALRFAIGRLGENASMLEQVRAALSNLEGTEAKAVRQYLIENLGSRPFILSYLAGLMGIHSARMPAFGAEFLYSLKTAVPSVFMPGKVAALPSMPEALVHPLYGIPIFDGPNSVLVTGFDDFGFFGALIYPLGAVVLYAGFNRVLRAIVKDGPIRLFVLFTLLFRILYIEQAFASVFVTLRNLIIIISIAWIIRKLPVLQLARRNRHLRMAAASSLSAAPASPARHNSLLNH